MERETEFLKPGGRDPIRFYPEQFRPSLCGVVRLEMVALKAHHVSDQEFLVLCGHSDEVGVQAV